MRNFILVFAACGITACGSDYKVTPGAEDNPGVDTGVEDEPTEDGGTDDPIDESGRPVAVCSVSPNPVTPPFEAATWDGTASYDPDGGTIIDYTWTLVEQPAGSSLNIVGAATSAPFTPQIAGTYTGQLVVTNNSGVASNPCEVDLDAIPAEDLWIEMYWERSGDDMDLHLLKPGANMGDLTTSSDCYYGNCVGSGLNWGASGPADNPVLDLDDISGTGPENINIDAPEEDTYMVVVHDYPGSVYNGTNNVTVNVYLDGSLEFTNTRNIDNEGEYVKIAEINYATRTITEL